MNVFHTTYQVILHTISYSSHGSSNDSAQKWYESKVIVLNWCIWFVKWYYTNYEKKIYSMNDSMKNYIDDSMDAMMKDWMRDLINIKHIKNNN